MVELSEREERWREVKKRFSLSRQILAVLFAVSYFLARHLVAQADLAHDLRVAASLLPLPFMAWFFWQEWRSSDRLDELERRIMHRASHLALLVTVAMLMTLGLFEHGTGINRAEFGYDHIWILPWLFQMVFGVAALKKFGWK